MNNSLIKTMKTQPDLFWSGDIGVVIQHDFVANLQAKLLRPSTHKFHMFMLVNYSADEKDWMIIESTPRAGVSIGRLSWYEGQEIEIYRPTGVHWTAGQRAVFDATKDGRKNYNFLLYVKLAYLVFNYCGRHLKPAPYTIFPPENIGTVVCSMFVNDGWKNLCPVFDQRYAPIPANFEQQLIDGKVTLIGKWPEDKSFHKYQIGCKPLGKRSL